MNRPRDSVNPSAPAEICTLLRAFFTRFPDESFHNTASRWFEELLATRREFPGIPGAWAGGLIYAISSWTPLKRSHVILNAVLEDLFGASMGSIRKRADEVWKTLEPALQSGQLDIRCLNPFTWRQEADGVCAYAFSGQPSDPKTQPLIATATRRIADLLQMKAENPAKYQSEIIRYIGD